MSRNQNWNDIGEQIRFAVQDALSTGDFKQLNEVVSGTVNSALTEAKRQVEEATSVKWSSSSRNTQDPYASGQVYQSGKTEPAFQSDEKAGDSRNQQNRTNPYKENPYRENPQSSNSYRVPPYKENPYKENPYKKNPYKEAASDRNIQIYRTSQPRGDVQAPTVRGNFLPRIRTKKVGHVSGILYMVFGGIGTGIMGIALLVIMILLLCGLAGMFWPLIFSGVLLAGFIFMIERGCMKKERLKRAERYVQLCGDKSYIDIEDLAAHMGRSRRFILKDVKKMIRLGIFPEGHLDSQESCLILSDATYRQYLNLQKERKALELEQKVTRMQEKQKGIEGKAESEKDSPDAGNAEGNAAAKEDAQAKEPENPELAAMIKEGKDCIRRLRDMNDAIEGEVISAKLFQLENLLKEIFDRLKEHPEQMSQMHKFMDYYLPTTLKLVEAYAEFDSVSVPGEDIISAKTEIEKTLDTINQAFVELLNKMFRDSVYDVTTDAQVLQTMLAKEGLTREKEFDKLLK